MKSAVQYSRTVVSNYHCWHLQLKAIAIPVLSTQIDRHRYHSNGLTCWPYVHFLYNCQDRHEGYNTDISWLFLSVISNSLTVNLQLLHHEQMEWIMHQQSKNEWIMHQTKNEWMNIESINQSIKPSINILSLRRNKSRSHTEVGGLNTSRAYSQSRRHLLPAEHPQGRFAATQRSFLAWR